MEKLLQSIDTLSCEVKDQIMKICDKIQQHGEIPELIKKLVQNSYIVDDRYSTDYVISNSTWLGRICGRKYTMFVDGEKAYIYEWSWAWTILGTKKIDLSVPYFTDFDKLFITKCMIFSMLECLRGDGMIIFLGNLDQCDTQPIDIYLDMSTDEERVLSIEKRLDTADIFDSHIDVQSKITSSTDINGASKSFLRNCKLNPPPPHAVLIGRIDVADATNGSISLNDKKSCAWTWSWINKLGSMPDVVRESDLGIFANCLKQTKPFCLPVIYVHAMLENLRVSTGYDCYFRNSEIYLAKAKKQ